MGRTLSEYFQNRWNGRDHSPEMIITGNSFKVKTNQGRLTQVLDNLVLNSEFWLKHSELTQKFDKPIITIEQSEPRILISDNGPGIDPAVEDNLFEPFITLKPKSQGRGLGLFIASQILESMGCAISLRPERNKHGRRYQFQLSLAGITID